MHVSIMLFLFLGPFAFGLANYVVPLQIGARDMAFPRLNLLSFYIYTLGFKYLEVGYAAAVSLILLLIILVFAFLNFRLAGGDNTR